ncbi:MAG: hypothetical protein EXR72_18990 [Myxococcales bacterium]|nr:hypothetical protein [Myxococcales bacterium]
MFDGRLEPIVGPLRFPMEMVKKGAVQQYGEVVILEGDDEIVTDDGNGSTKIRYDQQVQDPWSISRRFYERYPDQFDEVIVFTAFRDDGSENALAYEIQVRQDVKGIGRDPITKADHWGSQAALYAFVNMKGMDQYPRYWGVPITDPKSGVYPVLAQEFAHRWLAFMKYRDGGGADSKAMLGRDLAHWASTLESDASVMDGVRWADHGDGTFSVEEQNARFSKLDLYGMGLLPPEQVPPWYRISDAVDVGNGHKVEGKNGVQKGLVVKGKREEITIAQVIQALGPRIPAFGMAPRQFRVAFVLITRPGQRASEVLEKAADLEIVRKVWEDAFKQYTGGAGSMCTQVSAPCGSPVARVLGGTLVEVAGNGDGVIEPGETVAATFDLFNDGGGAAASVQVFASAPGVDFPITATIVPQLHAGERLKVTVRGLVGDGSVVCGKALLVEGRSAIGDHVWRGFAEAFPGTRDDYRARFDAGSGWWGVDLLHKDSVTSDGWQWGSPREYSYYGYFSFQPDGGAGGKGKAWFTGIERGNISTGGNHSLPKGVSTLWSPRIDLAKAIHPLLRYQAWFVALDVSNPRQAPVTADEDHLLLEASSDGAKWVHLDQLNGADDRWRSREIDLAAVTHGMLDLARPVQFRFTVNRNYDDEIVEAGIDDFAIVGQSESCLPSPPPDLGPAPPLPMVSGGGCTVSGKARGGGWAPLALALLLMIARRRRMRRPLGQVFRGAVVRP